MLLERLAGKRLQFVCGKGGVGKTSIASAIALARAEAGARVLLVSTDPAHSLGHLWQRRIGDQIAPLGPPSLFGLEIDPARATDAHLAQVRVRLQRWVPEHLRTAVDKHLKLARDAPGAHEAALLERIATTLEDEQDRYDLIVFDTAPSGHTTRLVELPETMAAWTRGMLGRHEHAQRFSAALKALDADDPTLDVVGPGRGRQGGETRDGEIRRVLFARQQRLLALRDTLQNAQHTAFIAVFTGERLPALETVELVTRLRGAGMPADALIVNRRSPADAGGLLAQRRAQEAEHIRWVTERLPGLPLAEVPLLGGDVTSVQTLRRIAQLL